MKQVEKSIGDVFIKQLPATVNWTSILLGYFGELWNMPHSKPQLKDENARLFIYPLTCH